MDRYYCQLTCAPWRALPNEKEDGGSARRCALRCAALLAHLVHTSAALSLLMPCHAVRSHLMEAKIEAGRPAQHHTY